MHRLRGLQNVQCPSERRGQRGVRASDVPTASVSAPCTPAAPCLLVVLVLILVVILIVVVIIQRVLGVLQRIVTSALSPAQRELKLSPGLGVPLLDGCGHGSRRRWAARKGRALQAARRLRTVALRCLVFILLCRFLGTAISTFARRTASELRGRDGAGSGARLSGSAQRAGPRGAGRAESARDQTCCTAPRR